MVVGSERWPWKISCSWQCWAPPVWLYNKSHRMGTRAVVAALVGLVTGFSAAVLRVIANGESERATEGGGSQTVGTDTYALHAARMMPDQYLADPDPTVSNEAFASFPTYLETLEPD